MRKVLTMLMVMAMLLGSMSAVFADDAVPADVAGTPYEAAVSNLLGREILTGYDDGTFKPENTINRAEACVVVVKALGVTDAELAAAGSNGFTDLESHPWAVNYINYAAGKGIVSGVGDNLFDPAGNVTYNQFAAMLVNAQGFKASDLTGSWPENYFNKAVELGIFANLPKSLESAADGNTAALRGDVALMVNQSLDKLATEAGGSNNQNANEEKDDEGKDKNDAENKKDEDLKDNGKDDSKNDKDDSKNDKEESEPEKTGDFSDYSGVLYGVITDTARMLNGKRETVHELEMFVNGKKHMVQTDGKVPVGDYTDYLDGLYGVKMTKGVVTAISSDFNALGAKDAKETTNGFEKVTSVSSADRRIETEKSSYMLSMEYYLYSASFQDGKMEEYSRRTSLKNIEVGDYVRVYDIVDGDSLADTVMIIKAEDYKDFK